MKIYIKSSIEVDIDTSLFEGTPIVPDTGMSYYNDFLNTKELDYKRKSKNRDGKIVMMTPEEYFSECSQHGFDYYVPVSDLKSQRRHNDKSLTSLNNMLSEGKKFWLPTLNYADHTQEGLHRMMVLGDLYGWNKQKYPVLVVTPYDQEKEDRWHLMDEMNDFIDDNAKKVCTWAITEMSDWYAPVPNNFAELYRQKIVDMTKSTWGIDIDVDIDIVEDIDNPCAKVYLSRYKTYEPEVWSIIYTANLDDYFDTSKDADSTKPSPSNSVNQKLLDMLSGDLDDDLFI